MFYNHDFLSRPKGGLGLIWVAATIGNKSSFRKLKDREVASVDVTEVCESVARPREPMALRLSSQLMFGVVRIYVQQTEMWISAVQNTHMMIRKVISDMSASTTTHLGPKTAGSAGLGALTRSSAIDLPARSAASQKGITLPINNYYFAGDFDWVGVWSLDEERRRELAIREGELVSQTSEGGIASDKFESSLHGITASSAGSSGIGPLEFFEGASMAGVARAPRHTAEQSRITSQSTRWALAGIGPEGPEPEETRLSALEAGPGDEGMEAHLDLELELPGEGLALADDGVTFRDSREPSSILRRALLNGDDVQMEDVPFDLGGDDIPGDGEQFSSPGRRPREDDEDGGVVSRPKTKKVKFAREDSAIELNAEVIRHASENYTTEMLVQTRTELERKKNRTEEEEVRHMVFGPLWITATRSSILAEMWNETVGSRLRERQEQIATLRAALLTATATPGVEGFEMQEVGQEGMLMLRSSPSAGQGDIFDQPYFDDDQFMFAAGAPPPGGEPSSSRPPSEVGRSASGSAERPLLPWTLPRERGDVTALPGDDTRSVRSLTVEGPEGLRRIAGEGSVGSEGIYSRRASVFSQGAGFLETGEESTMASQLVPSQVLREEQESEQDNFFTYVQDIKASLPDDQPLFFSDVAPVADTSPGVAAQAFYHVLALATNSLFKVKQEEAYGEIEITIV